MEIKVVIPSHKRAGKVLAKNVVDGAIICIPESQAEEYLQANPENEIVTHPDTVIGLTAKRQWIYEHFGDVFMLDDDVVAMHRLYEKDNVKVTNKALVREIIEATAYNARQCGAYLFGFSKNPVPASYKSMKPIELTGYITGCATGLLSGSKLFYNTRINCNEDYWISCLNAYYHRFIYKDTRFVFIQSGTFTSQGGLAEFRNLAAEEEDFKYLRKCFGDIVDLKTDTNQRKRKHQFEKTMRVPF